MCRASRDWILTAERFRQILLKTASLVKPIMVRHKWKVGTLAEVSPDTPWFTSLAYDVFPRLRIDVSRQPRTIWYAASPAS